MMARVADRPHVVMHVMGTLVTRAFPIEPRIRVIAARCARYAFPPAKDAFALRTGVAQGDSRRACTNSCHIATFVRRCHRMQLLRNLCLGLAVFGGCVMEEDT